MPAQTLLEINPDELFQNHTISEVSDIQIKILNEIEKKREELRTLVGEKCRDLLKAADTITEMKETSHNVVLGINEIKKICQTSQEKRGIGFKQLTNKTSELSNGAEEISKIIEIKILLTLPEQIWTSIDNKDYLLSAQLFLFATHLHLGLEVSPNAQKISKKYPVLSKQWEIISSCKKTILDGARSELKIITLTTQKASECLCTLILLEVMSYEKLLNEFLDLQMSSLKDILKSDELSRKKLGLIVKLLQFTFVILYFCFLDQADKKCGIQEQLDLVTAEEQKPTLSKIIQVSSLPERYVSPLVLSYRPKASSKLMTLTSEVIKTTLRDWLENVKQLLQVEFTKLLLLIDEIKRLHKIIKEEVFSIKYPSNWDDIVACLLSERKLNIYDNFIKSYITKRVQDLIELTWQKNMKNILICLNQIDDDESKDRKKQPENDIRWFVWKENKIDVEEFLKLKTLGYTSRVMSLCTTLNAFLDELLKDVQLYVGEDPSSRSDTAKRNTDAKILFSFLSSCSFEMLKRFTKSVKESYEVSENENNESNVIIRARFLSSLTNLCPALEKCLRQNHLHEDFEESTRSNMWHEANVFLKNESIEMWRIWSVITSSKLKNLIKNKLDAEISLRNLLKSKPLSEIVIIEEQTEDDKTFKSELRVPSQPSLPLQELLFQICQQLNAVIPHTLPREIHENLVNTITKNILEHYLEWSKADVIYQSQAWQMLLDVRFLTLLIITKENKDLSRIICETLEKTIDPFDLDVYFPHVQNSVKKSTQKLQGTFGVLINFTEKLPVFNGLKLNQSSKIEEPNLLAVSNSAPWFPLLPVTNIGARRPDSSRFDGQDPSTYKEYSAEKSHKSKEKENKKESVTSDFFKSAGAFFDAMTGGWS